MHMILQTWTDSTLRFNNLCWPIWTVNPVIIGGTVSGFFFVLIITLIVILCRRYNSEKRKYNKNYLHNRVLSSDKFVEGTLVLSSENTFHQEFAYKAPHAVPVTPANDYHHHETPDGTTSRGGFRSMANQVIQERSPILRVLRQMTKHNESQETNGSEPHDSGKGESEHESLSSHNQNTYRSDKPAVVAGKPWRTLFSIQQTIQESRFGPNCVSECSMNGHSDQCWLIEMPRHFPRSQKTDYKGSDISLCTTNNRLLVELKPVETSSSRNDIVESSRAYDCNELYFQQSPPLDPRYTQHDQYGQSHYSYNRGHYEHFPTNNRSFHFNKNSPKGEHYCWPIHKWQLPNQTKRTITDNKIYSI